MAYKYGLLVKTMWFTSFYSSIMPIGIVFALINVVFTYLIDKYLILKRYARTPLLSADLNREMIESLEYCPFFMCLGSYFFHSFLYDSTDMDKIADVIAICLSCINFVFPAAKCNEMLFNTNEVNEDTTSYDDARKGFVSVYMYMIYKELYVCV